VFTGIFNCLRRGAFAFLGAALLAGCAGNDPVRPGLAAASQTPGMGQDGFEQALDGEYTLRPGDVINLTVFREPELSLSSVPVSADGRISIPLVGSQDVAGRTPSEVELQIESLLNSRYLRNADVAVNILEYGSHVVTVEGAVETPGVFEFRPGTRLSGGVATAEGLTRVANRTQVAVFREGPEGIQVAKFDYGQVMAGTMLDPVLQPGDRIVVGTDSLSQFWRDLLASLPAFALFTNVNF